MSYQSNLRRLRSLKAAFLRLKSVADLCQLLDKSQHQIVPLARLPYYRTFAVPKRDGSDRWIEDPYPPLKEIQDKLNDYLQTVYFFNRTKAAYGFVLNPKGDPAPRQIVSNARQHLGQLWLLNVDLYSFFHQVKEAQVQALFLDKPFRFSEDLAELLTKLTCHQGRLPMGAPTSPVLSNFALIPLDKELEHLANSRQWVYTRYADDMSFSSKTAITEEHISEIRNLATNHGFPLKEEKVRLYKPEDEKQVTQLKLGKNKVELPDDFLELAKKEIQRFGEVLLVESRLSYKKSKWVAKYNQKLEGMLQFAEQVVGENDPVFRELNQLYEQAHETTDRYDAVSWLDFTYL